MVWSSAWLSGFAAADDVLDALQDWAELHEVVAADAGTASTLDIPARGTEPGHPTGLLAALRRAGAGGGRLVLPVPGDVRGLGTSGEFAAEALHTGEAVVHGALGVVPEAVAEGVLRWTVFDLPAPPVPNVVPLADAEHELTGAMRVTAGLLTELGVAKHRTGVRDELRDRLAALPKVRWPQGMPPRALRVLQRATEVSAILDLAGEDDPGGALSASAAVKRAQALRPLFDAARIAQCAAIDEAVRTLSNQSGRV